MKITNMIHSILYEEEKEENNSKVIEKVDNILKTEKKKGNKKVKEGMFAKMPEKKTKGIKVFYQIKANISNTDEIMDTAPETEEDVAATGQTPTTPETPIETLPTTAPPANLQQSSFANNPLFQSTKYNGKMLNEEVYSFSKTGETIIPKDNTDMISSMEGLIDYMTKDESSEKGAILDEVMNNILMIASGVNGNKQLTSIIKKEDYIYCSIDCGNSVEDSIGILLRKVAGVNLVSLNLKKDGNILAAFSLQDFNTELIRFVNDIKTEV